MFKLFSPETNIMKKLIIITLLFLTQSVIANGDSILDKIKPIQKEWAIVKYRMTDDKKAEAYERLAIHAADLAAQYPDRAEPLIWQAINLSSYAGAVGGIKSITKALPAVKKARDLLLQAVSINQSALDGSVYTSLGALYYQVPGWPIGFGDKRNARIYLEKAMAENQNKLDAGYFYGDYLVKQKNYTKARSVLEQALQQPVLVDRPVADQGRRDEIRILLDNVMSKIKS